MCLRKGWYSTAAGRSATADRPAYVCDLHMSLFFLLLYVHELWYMICLCRKYKTVSFELAAGSSEMHRLGSKH